MQADAYAGYDRLYEAGRRPGPIVEARCWAHVRRKFFDLARLNKAPSPSRRWPASMRCSPSSATSTACRPVSGAKFARNADSAGGDLIQDKPPSEEVGNGRRRRRMEEYAQLGTIPLSDAWIGERIKALRELAASVPLSDAWLASRFSAPEPGAAQTERSIVEGKANLQRFLDSIVESVRGMATSISPAFRPTSEPSIVCKASSTRSIGPPSAGLRR